MCIGPSSLERENNSINNEVKKLWLWAVLDRSHGLTAGYSYTTKKNLQESVDSSLSRKGLYMQGLYRVLIL